MMVSMWFKNETNLVTMVDLHKNHERTPGKTAYQISGQKCEGENGSQSSENALDKGTCFVLRRTQKDERT